ncbi:MAG: pilin [Candidatus Dojkabacteria bacterium]|nr:MAG: pilin [Candidatus Dojkabacteria bacterium]
MDATDLIEPINPTDFATLSEFVVSTMNLIISIAALVAVIALVWAGFQYIISRGEGEKAEKAQKSIIYILIGLVLCFISPLVINFILVQVLGQ